MKSDDKVGAIVVIWGIVGGLLLLVLIVKVLGGGELTFNETLLGGAAMLAAGLASFGIATSGRVESLPSTSRKQSRGGSKAKTSDMALAERLMDSMTDEEIASLRRRLVAHESAPSDDDEIVTLEEVLRA